MRFESVKVFTQDFCYFTEFVFRIQGEMNASDEWRKSLPESLRASMVQSL